MKRQKWSLRGDSITAAEQFPIDIDGAVTLYVLEVKYRSGYLLRWVYDEEALARKDYEFVRDRASTEWEQLHEVTLDPAWRSLARTES